MFNWAWGKGKVAAATFAAAIGALLLGAASPARAATLVNDTWLDGTDSDPAAPVHSEMGVDGDVDNDLESAWYQGGTGTLDPVAAGGPLRGNLTAGGTSSGSWTTYFTPEASPVTLAQGETLKVTWQFSLTNVGAANTSQNFRVALVDTPAANRLSANGSPGTAAYTGYGMFMNMGAPTLGNSSPFQLRERAVASGSFLSTAGDWGANGVANTGLANGATSGNAGYEAGVTYTMIWELERTLLDELQVDVSIAGGTLDGDGLASVSVLDASPNGFTYDTFGIRPSSAVGTAEIFDTSLFKVEYTAIPEPASLTVLGLSGLAILRRRRSRRRSRSRRF
jgi:hypothetical protein